MKYKTLEYFALIDPVKAPGVSKKIDNLVTAANTSGMSALKSILPVSLSGLLSLWCKLITCKADVAFVRFSDVAFPFLFLPFCILRLRGKKLVIDIPTPRIVCIKEMELNIKNPLVKFFRKGWSFISASWILFPANLIVQYADEHLWFSYGVKRKTIKTGNGILIGNQIPIVDRSQHDKRPITLIAVAQLADWHGYDRLLRALSKVKIKSQVDYQLILIGDGEALLSLKELAKSLLLDNVIFTGRLIGDSLDKKFEIADVGVASLGLYRIGLEEASVLKTREYMARGIPVISAGNDPDFSTECTFRFNVENRNEIDSIVECLENLPKMLVNISPEQVRHYAVSNLSIDAKLRELLEAI